MAFIVFVLSFPVNAFPTNGGFETTVSTTGVPPDWLPTDFGYWSGDVTGIVSTSQGITPFEGSQMLHFINAASSGPGGVMGSELWQIVDISAYSADITAGVATASASAYFNRISFDSQTDTFFGVDLHAYAGASSTFPSQWLNSELASAWGEIGTDSNLATWEMASVNLDLPVNTDFLVIRIYAAENVFNDISGVEFDGHYADAVSLSISAVPEPTTIALLGIGLAGLGGGYIRRKLKKTEN